MAKRLSVDENTLFLLRLDESHDKGAFDSSPNRANAFGNNVTAVSVTGKPFRYARRFNRSSDSFLRVLDPSTIFDVPNYTIEFWMYLLDDPLTVESFAKIADCIDASGGWEIYFSGGELRFLLRDGGVNAVLAAVSDSVFQLLTWYHVAGTWDGSTARLYVDGVEVDSTPAVVPGTSYPVDKQIYLGADYPLGDRFYFNGYLADFRFSDRARPPWEIANVVKTLTDNDPVDSLADDGNAVFLLDFDPPSDSVPTPIAHYKHDQGTYDGTTVLDEIGGNDGTAATPDAISVADGIYDDALSFTAATGGYDCGGAAALRILGDVTLAWWGKVDTAGNGASRTIVTCSGSGETEDINYLYRARINTSEYLEWFHEYGAGANELITATYGVVPNDQWDFYAVVRDATAKEIRFYINGVHQETIAFTSNASGGTSTTMSVGQNGDGSNPYYGDIDNLMIFNQALGLSDIESLYERVTKIADSVGSHDGSTVGEVRLVHANETGYGRKIPGGTTQARISIPASAAFNMNVDKTIFLMFNIESVPSDDYRLLYGQFDTVSGDAPLQVRIAAGTTDRLQVVLDDGTNSITLDTNNLVSGMLKLGHDYKLAITWDVSAKRLTGYLNGMPFDTGVNASINANLLNSSDPLTVGGGTVVGPAYNHIDGTIKQVGMFDRLFTADEIRKLALGTVAKERTQ